MNNLLGNLWFSWEYKFHTFYTRLIAINNKFISYNSREKSATFSLDKTGLASSLLTHIPYRAFFMIMSNGTSDTLCV